MLSRLRTLIFGHPAGRALDEALRRAARGETPVVFPEGISLELLRDQPPQAGGEDRVSRKEKP